MPSNKKILLSGVKPTGRPHIGNYFGAMRQFVELQDKYESRVFIADYHALTTLQNAKELSENIIDVALDYLAIGLDSKKVTLFKQSDVPEVAELAWIFNCVTTMPYLERAHAYKDAAAKGKEVNVGTFDYPMLMAADILIQDADVVPVGQDQKQHVEYARDTAEKFNRIFGEVFKLPEPVILENVKTVPGIDGQKMSKSYGNIIPIFASDEEIKKLVMAIVTDSGEASRDEAFKKSREIGEAIINPVSFATNVFSIHSLFRSQAELVPLYNANQKNYKALKEALITDMTAFIAPLRARREALAKDPEVVLKILKEGGEKARAYVAAKMKKIRKLVGVQIS